MKKKQFPASRRLSMFRFTRLLCVFLGALIFALCSIGGVRAWWAEGHQMMTRAAASKMPADVPEFFRKGVVELAEASAEPDNWKHITAPHLKASEQPEHYIDL